VPYSVREFESKSVDKMIIAKVWLLGVLLLRVKLLNIWLYRKSRSRGVHKRQHNTIDLPR
jgi:hypothetical protein